MELNGSVYLYTLATLAMTFVGFCAIVLVFRQSMGAQSSAFHRYASHIYIELGFMSAAFAMLAPLMATGGLAHDQVWRASSALIVVALALHTFSILKHHAHAAYRRRAHRQCRGLAHRARSRTGGRRRDLAAGDGRRDLHADAGGVSGRRGLGDSAC
jgi:hypothetical protein